MKNIKIRLLLCFILTYYNLYFINCLWGSSKSNKSGDVNGGSNNGNNSFDDTTIQKKVQDALAAGTIKLDKSTLHIHLSNNGKPSTSPYKKYIFEVLITILANVIVVPILHEVFNYLKKTILEAQEKSTLMEARMIDKQFKDTYEMLSAMRELGITPSVLKKALEEKKKKTST